MFYVSKEQIKLQILSYCVKNKNYDQEILKTHPYYLYNKLSYEKENPFTVESPVTVSLSKYGKGLFATKNIKKNSVVSIYPAHGIAYLADINANKSNIEHIEQCKKNSLYNQVILKEYGEYYDGVFKNSDYTFNIDETTKIYGSPKVENHNWFNSHFANDMAYKENGIVGNNVDEICRFILSYMINNKNNNCFVEFLDIDGITFLVFIANRNITIGEEICINYEESYWLSRKGIKYTKQEYLNMLSYYLLNKPPSQKRYYFNLIKNITSSQ